MKKDVEETAIQNEWVWVAWVTFCVIFGLAIYPEILSWIGDKFNHEVHFGLLPRVLIAIIMIPARDNLFFWGLFGIITFLGISN